MPFTWCFTAILAVDALVKGCQNLGSHRYDGVCSYEAVALHIRVRITNAALTYQRPAKDEDVPILDFIHSYPCAMSTSSEVESCCT